MTVLKQRPRKTVEDFMRLPEGTPAELIEGEILMSPAAQERHQTAVTNLVRELSTFVRKGRLGRVFAPQFDVHLPSGDVVEPDVMYVRKERESIIQRWIMGVPDLVVEVVSPSHPERDRIVKRRLYEKNGVPEYWIVDPEEESVEVLVFNDGRFESLGYFLKGAAIRSEALPGFPLPVEEIFKP